MVWLEKYRQWMKRSREASFLRFTAGEFARDDCFAAAGSLTYATLLALVPVLALIGAVAAAMPGSDAWQDRIIDFLNNNFLALADQSMRQELIGRLQEFASNTRGLTWTMAVFLIFSAVMLITNIEKALNRIWGVQTSRSWVNRFVIYWSTLTFGPILLGASLALSTYFFSLDIVRSTTDAEVVVPLLQFGTPFLVATMAFFLLFVIVPNRQVSWRHAIVGALVTALMFELAKKGFGWYIGRSETYGQIYGALAVIPIFLVWIYLSWSVILLGASFTASLESFRFRETEHTWPEPREFVLLYRLVGHFHQAQLAGQSLSVSDLMALEPGSDDHQIQTLLENLRQARILRRDEEGEWVLIRDLGQLSLDDLYRTGRYVWPLNADPVDQDADLWNESLTAALQQITQPLNFIASKPLKSFYQSEAGEVAAVNPVTTRQHG